MGISRLTIRNYRGIEALDQTIPPSGMVATGKSGSGKTTILNAIEAALLARDIGPDAIRKGADKSEILIDMDAHTVRRVITQSGSSVAVLRDGMKAPKPQTYLVELLGTSSLDPMDLLTLNGKQRKARILEALPIQVSVEQMRKWVPRIPDSYDVSGHGLEVIERARTKAYAQRTEANARAKLARSEAERLEIEASRMRRESPPDMTQAEPMAVALDAARANVAQLQACADESARMEERSRNTRERIASLRDQAQVLTSDAVKPRPETERELENSLEQLNATILRLRCELDVAERAFVQARNEMNAWRAQNQAHQQRMQRAQELLEQAKALETTLAETAVEFVPPEVLARARMQVQALQAQHDAALAGNRAFAETMSALDQATKAASEAEAAELEANRLDTIVKALTYEAPAELIASSDGIPGLSIADDQIMLDGVSIDALSGSEQVRFAVEVARRANAKSKILIVDGLERLDPEACEVFVREATRDGFQLLATRVDRGEMVIEAIHPESPIDLNEGVA